MKQPKEIALTFVQEKTNPRISIKMGDRGAGLAMVALYRKLLDKYLPAFLEALKQEGPVNKVAALSKNWGDKAYVQVNIAEALAQGKAKPKFAEVLKKFLAEIKNTETVPYNFDKNTKFKVYKIKLNSRLNPSAKADLAIYDIVDPNIGLVVAEIVEDATGISKKGIAAFQKLSGEAQRAAQPQQPKLTTFKGKKGYWITTGGGRRVFIEEGKFKGYQRWTKWSNVGKRMTKAGAIGIGLGVLAGGIGGGMIGKVTGINLVGSKGIADDIMKQISHAHGASFKTLLKSRMKAASKKEAQLATGKILTKIGKEFAETGKLLAITGIGLWAANAAMAAWRRRKAPKR